MRHRSRGISLSSVAFLLAVVAASCAQAPSAPAPYAAPDLDPQQVAGQVGQVGQVKVDCDGVCNNAGVTCGSVPDPVSGTTCCCIGTCPGSAGLCGACIAGGGAQWLPPNVCNKTDCEGLCNGAGVTCGSVPDPATGTTCCCIGTCPQLAGMCASCINSGAATWEPGICNGIDCESACNNAGVTCGSVPDPASGTQCCCIGTCPGFAGACAACVQQGGNWAGNLCAIAG